MLRMGPRLPSTLTLRSRSCDAGERMLSYAGVARSESIGLNWIKSEGSEGVISRRRNERAGVKVQQPTNVL